MTQEKYWNSLSRQAKLDVINGKRIEHQFRYEGLSLADVVAEAIEIGMTYHGLIEVLLERPETLRLAANYYKAQRGLSLEAVTDIRTYLPTYSNKQMLADKHDVSLMTIGRVFNSTHPLTKGLPVAKLPSLSQRDKDFILSFSPSKENEANLAQELQCSKAAVRRVWKGR